MSCTAETYTALKAARQNIAAGTNVVEVTIDGESTKFGAGNVGLLNQLIANCEQDLGLVEDNPFINFRGTKGLEL